MVVSMCICKNTSKQIITVRIGIRILWRHFRFPLLLVVEIFGLHQGALGNFLYSIQDRNPDFTTAFSVFAPVSNLLLVLAPLRSLSSGGERLQSRLPCVIYFRYLFRTYDYSVQFGVILALLCFSVKTLDKLDSIHALVSVKSNMIFLTNQFDIDHPGLIDVCLLISGWRQRDCNYSLEHKITNLKIKS